MCNVKSILYKNWWWPAQWLDWESPKHFPKSNLHQKKVVVTVWWSALWPLWLSESQQNHYIWEVCSANCKLSWKLQCLQLTLVNRMNPVLLHENTWLQHITDNSKVEWIGLQNFASSAIFTRSLTNWLPLLQASRQLFAGKILPQPAGGRKCFPRAYWILMHGFLRYRDK